MGIEEVIAGLVVLFVVAVLVLGILRFIWSCRIHGAQKEILEKLSRLGSEMRGLRERTSGPSPPAGTVPVSVSESGSVLASGAAVPVAPETPLEAATGAVSSGGMGPSDDPAVVVGSKPRLSPETPPPSPPVLDGPPPPLPAVRPPRRKSRLELAALETIRKVWNWIIVGEEYRREGLSVEFAVATNWLIRLGVVIVVAAVGFGLRLSIDRGWVPPLGRVVLGLLAGAGMIAAGLRLLGPKYRLFGQGMIGGGLAALYFSLFAAHQLYALIPALAAFVFMALVTLGAGVIAVSVNSILVAVLGIIGGYATPFILTGTDAGFVSFYTYLAFLRVGILGIAHWRRWVLLNYLGLVFTYVHVGLSLRHYGNGQFWQVMPFLVLFFVLYSALIVIYNLRTGGRSSLIELGGLLANSAVFFLIGFGLVQRTFRQEWAAVITLALAAFYILLVFVFLRRGLVDRPLLLFLLALSGFYVGVTMPVLLSHQWLTASWALQALLMLWLGRKLDSRFLRYLSYALYAFVIWRMVFFGFGQAFGGPRRGLTLLEYGKDLVSRLLSFGIPIGCLAGAYRLHSGEVRPAPVTVRKGADVREFLAESIALEVLLSLAFVCTFFYLSCEISRMFYIAHEPLRLPMLTCLWLAFAAGLLTAAVPGMPAWIQRAAWVLLIALLVKFVGFDLPSWRLSPGAGRYLGSAYQWSGGLMRLLDFGVIIAFLVWVASLLADEGRAQARRAFLALACAFLFIFLTFELNTFLAHFVPGLRAGGVTILWSGFALVAVVRGIREDIRMLRYAGLGLFAVVGLKVFLSDLASLSPTYKMLALLVLGGIVLSGSLIYLRNAQHFQAATEDMGS